MKPILFQNIDREDSKLRSALQRIIDEPCKYLAILLQDCPKNLSPEAEQQLETIAATNWTIYSSSWLDKQDESTPIRLISIINIDLCIANRHTKAGNTKAASLILDIELANTDDQLTNQPNRQFYLANTYIKPKASPIDTKTLLQEIAKTVDYKTSRLVSAGDLNASSALWEPQNLDNNTKALKTKNKFYADKTQRGVIIERFAARHNLKVLPQTGRPTYTFIEPGIGENSGPIKGSLIDIALVSRKANRAWHAVKVGLAIKEKSRQHLTIEILASNKKQQSGSKHRRVFRYRPQRILPYDLIELKIKTSKLRNNWRLCTRDAVIQRLETMTNLIIETTKRLQETKARVCLTRH